jgi:hypothetical protein
MSGLGLMAAFGLGLAPESAAASDAQRPTVVELFTSQGCSSCPPADELLGEIGKRPDVLALSLPVDYWDYIGWKDTFASAANTERQRAYSHSLHHRSIYTPEMIVDGLYDVVGSDRGQVDKTLATARARRVGHVPVDVEITPKTVTVLIGEGRAEQPATIWLVRYDPKHTVVIGSGENNGRHITYHNVVRTMSSIGTWNGAKVSIPMNRRLLGTMPGEQTAVIVQYGKTGPIVGAADFARATEVDAQTGSASSGSSK